jgi:hypothetical protein
MATKTTVTPGPTPAAVVLAAPYGAEGPLIAGTSQTPNPVDTLTAKSFTINEYNRSFYLDTRLRATAVGFTDTFFEGLVTAWDGQVVTIAPDLAHNASPTIYSNWNINVAGQPGIQGVDGPVGPAGPSGGPVGSQGPPGAPGAVWRNGNGVPANSLGADGDYYLDDLTGDVYMRAVSIYSIVANIHGADGAMGPVGPVGPTGPQGIIEEAPTDGGYYARRNGAWDSPPGGGNVSAVGTPTAGQLASWTSPNTIQGIDVIAGDVLVSGTPVTNQWAQWTDGTHIQGVDVSATPWLQKAGDSMSGDLIVSKAAPAIELRKTAADQFNQIYGRNGTSVRWSLYLGDATAESGNNVGSDFKINNYDDTGAFLSNALSIARSTGLATVAADPAAPLGIATKQYVDAAAITPTAGLLTWLDATHLKFAPCRGDKIKINGKLYDIPVAGIDGLGMSGVYMNGNPNQILTSGATYLVFAFILGSTITADYRQGVSHAPSQTPGNIGTEVLFSSPNYDDTRSLIGIVRVNTSQQFADNTVQRFVRSWFNRTRKSVSGPPISGVSTSYTVTFSSLGSVAEWVSFADDVSDMIFSGFSDHAGSGSNYSALMVDGNAAGAYTYCYSAGAGYWSPVNPSYADILVEGYHNASIGAFVSGGSGTWYGTTYVTIG